PAPQQTPKSKPDTRLPIPPIPPGTDDIYPQQLEDIPQPPKHFLIMVISINVESITSTHKMPVQPSEQRYLIGQKPVEMMLEMRRRIEIPGRAIGVIRRYLETIEIFTGEKGLVAIEMLVIGQIHRVGVKESPDREPVPQFPPQF